MVLYLLLLLFFIKKQSVLPSWAQVSGQDKCPACVDITPVSAAITWTGRMVALENHGAGVSGLSCVSISARPHKWGVSTSHPREQSSSGMLRSHHIAGKLPQELSWSLAQRIWVASSPSAFFECIKSLVIYYMCGWGGMGFDRKWERNKSLINLLWMFFGLCLELSSLLQSITW